ncbi:hypothetical protein QYS47_30225 [Marivirga arenosa]|uniref:Uncharacterized protein n=2 Tax=Marivirga arenosa TaxID=3059076 RepID=A0AA51ZX99_9BACT|nr:hypothetical protein QYS47_30225 [Marivirga sp. BKB1-2]
MIKLNFIFLMFANIFLFANSNDNASVENYPEKDTDWNNCYLTPQIVPGGNCYGSGSAGQAVSGTRYTVAVTAGYNGAVNYNRTIELMLSKGSTIIDAAYVTIPAGATVSNNQDVFQIASERYGDVTITIANVNGSSSSACSWRSTTNNVRNCYHDDGNYSGGGLPGRDPEIPIEPNDPTNPNPPCIMDANGNCI